MIVLLLCRHIKVTSPLIYHQELALILSLISENNQFRRKKKTALSTLRTRVPPITYSHTAHCLISWSDWIPPPPQPNFLAKGTGGTHRPHIVHFTTYNHMCSIDFTRWLFFIQFASYLNYCVLHSNINRRGVISMTFSQSKISVRPFMLAWVQTLHQFLPFC